MTGLRSPFSRSTLRARNQFRDRASLVEQMTQGQQGMPEQHTRPGVTHYRLNPCALLRTVAVDFTPVASRLFFLERADFQAPKRISEQLIALAAEIFTGGVMIVAKEMHHCLDGRLLACNPRPGDPGVVPRSCGYSFLIVQSSRSTRPFLRNIITASTRITSAWLPVALIP